jgi:L-aminopeptidase/D-esterase-like protein
VPGLMPPGPKNAITDVPGVAVGHETVFFENRSTRFGAHRVTGSSRSRDCVFLEKVRALSTRLRFRKATA